MDNNNGIWIGMADKNNDPEIIESSKKEFVELPIAEAITSDKATSLETNRRDFLKYLGFGLGAATVAASCDIPVKRAIPYVTKPDAIVPGVATYYASAFVDGGDFCPVLVKTREGRPIKIEGNVLSSITKGGTSARAQASVLSLYDTSRLKNPGKIVNAGFPEIEKMTWADLDKEIVSKLGSASNVRILTNTVLSPTTKKVFEAFKAKYPSTKVVTYDPISSAGILEANELSFGERVLPDYHFDKAELIVSFGADFLGTWISPTEYTKGYAENRKVNKIDGATMSRHIQVEAGMSLTGSNADNRILIRPSEQGAAIATLYKALGGDVAAPKLNDKAKNALIKVAEQLKAASGKSIVVAGSNNVMEQVIVNKINALLGNLGKTVQFSNASYQRQGSDKAIQGLIREMQSGGVDALLVLGNANPAFDLYNSEAFKAAATKVGLKIALAYEPNETFAICNYAAPIHHYLESWGDAQPKRGSYALIQPTIAPLFKTRQLEDSLLTWAGAEGYNPKAEQPYFDYLKASWRNKFAGQTQFATFSTFWEDALHNGVVEMSPANVEYTTCNASLDASRINKPTGAEIEVELTECVPMGSGQYANNPWLMEMPDPVHRASWGNYLGVPVEFDGKHSFLGYKGIGDNIVKGYADVVKLEGGKAGEGIEVTAFPQFGQAPNSVSTALGYGRTVCGDAGINVGSNMFPLTSPGPDGNTVYYATDVAVSDIIDTNYDFPCVQYHHTYGVTTKNEAGETFNADEAALVDFGYGLVDQGYQGSLTNRSVIYQTNLKDLPAFKAKLDHKREEAQHLNSKSLYPGHDDLYGNGHHWGMFIDTNSCTGCGACTVACMAENNVPVVGAKEVSRHHEMTWLRIDRYYYGKVDSPNSVYQPMMCQHCDNAPCENVCPANATNHSAEGLNQMTYNRCVGTRYCANNCPYKVRRFNWMDYNTADLFPWNQVNINEEKDMAYGADNLTRMVLNPDVTVRVRGVIEKCSFCVQRIQQGKLTAKAEQRALRDADVRTACQTACPSSAIIFGDMNNDEGYMAKSKENHPLAFIALEEINVRSSVTYTARVNNRDESIDEAQGFV